MDQQQKMKEMLADLWRQHYPAILERIDILSQAMKSLQEGKLDSNQRQAAQSAAHKLAGVLGTFGRAEGTDLARSIENYFANEPELSDRKVDLQAAIVNLKKTISL